MGIVIGPLGIGPAEDIADQGFASIPLGLADPAPVADSFDFVPEADQGWSWSAGSAVVEPDADFGWTGAIAGPEPDYGWTWAGALTEPDADHGLPINFLTAEPPVDDMVF